MMDALLLVACLSHSPFDPRCSMADMRRPAAELEFYRTNWAARQMVLLDCSQPRVVRPPDCAVAMLAERQVHLRGR